MKNRVTIQAALKVAKHAENVEVIELALEGYQRVLVRSKAMPEFAFLVWSDYRGSTYSWLGLDLPGTSDRYSSYQVLCACCGTHVYGVSKPEDVGEIDSDGYNEWSNGLGQVFKSTLEETCKKNGITTIFMRRASNWHYSKFDGINIVEAWAHQNAMMFQYGRQVVQANTEFISRITSRGMFQHS